MAEEREEDYCLEAGTVRVARAPFRRAVVACPDRAKKQTRLGFSVFICEHPDYTRPKPGEDAFAFCDPAQVRTEAELKRYLQKIESEILENKEIVKQEAFDSEEFRL